MQASRCLFGLLKQLSCVVLGRHLGCRGHLNQKDEDEDTENSDYESDAGKTVEPVSREIERGSEQNGQQKLFSVLKFWSSVT